MPSKLLIQKDGYVKLDAISSDPGDPADGCCVFWLSDGTDTGDDGDLIVKSTVGAVTTEVNVSKLLAGGITSIEVVDTLPDPGTTGVVYLLRP